MKVSLFFDSLLLFKLNIKIVQSSICQRKLVTLCVKLFTLHKMINDLIKKNGKHS